MARPLRLEYPGACYHVMNRGNRRQTVFGSDDDVDLFLDRLGEFSLSYHVKVLCYCLMSNHFHLYVKTVDANLSKFMQSLLTSFTILKNRRDRNSGHLFQGRYKAVLVEDEAYGSELSRYIHLNPARTTSAKAMDIERRRALLRAQKLSSYSSIIGLAKSPEWLEPSLILDKWDGTLKEQRLKYSRYVEEGLMRDICNPMESAVARTVLGSDTFVDKIRRALKDISENLNLRRELGEKAKLISCVDLWTLTNVVCKFYGVERAYVLTRNSRNNEPRQVLLYLACKYCRGRYSISELGQALGLLTVGAMTRSRYNISVKIKADKKFNAKVAKIEKLVVKS